MTNKELINLARQAYKNSYAPYSKVRVGAVLLCPNEKLFTGCNIENASYGLTMCAERVAVYNAIAAGQKEFLKIVIASNQKREFSPCGACRQVLAEFSRNITVVWQDEEGKTKTKVLNKLLPSAFKK